MSTSQSQRPKAEKLTPDLHPEFWYIHGKAYDLSEFINRHPGGSRALWLTRGRDCTEMFESYHCLTDKPKQVMAKFYVGEQEDYSPMFEWNDTKVNAFGIELRAEVRQYIKDNNIDIHVPYFRLAWITAATIFAFYLMFAYYWSPEHQTWWSIIACPVIIWTAFVNSFHDASHFAFSKNWYLTTFFTYAWPWFSSPTTWDHEHVIAHHVYTNIHKMDPDLNHGMPIFRMHPKFKFRWIMKFQMYFVWFVWGVATLWLSNTYDFQALLLGYYHGMKSCPFVKMSKPRLALHLFGRFCAWFFHTGIPLLLFPFWKAMFLSLTFNFFFSWCFMATTQINHLTPSSLQPAVKNSRCWAEHQVVTAQAFAHDSMFWWIFSGGLNYQIEHHLFPGVNHDHLPGIKPIVQRLCKKYNIDYHYSETWSGLVEQYFEVVRRGAIAEHPGFE